MKYISKIQYKTVYLVTIFASLVLVACGGGAANSASAPDPVACIASVAYSEPVFKITSASNANTNAAIPQVTLSNITQDGKAADLTVLSQMATNTVFSANTATCTISCGFSVLEGVYAMTVSAPGYQDKPIQFSAKYSTSTNGCPATMGGGAVVSVALSPL